MWSILSHWTGNTRPESNVGDGLSFKGLWSIESNCLEVLWTKVVANIYTIAVNHKCLNVHFHTSVQNLGTSSVHPRLTSTIYRETSRYIWVLKEKHNTGTKGVDYVLRTSSSSTLWSSVIFFWVAILVTLFFFLPVSLPKRRNSTKIQAIGLRGKRIRCAFRVQGFTMYHSTTQVTPLRWTLLHERYRRDILCCTPAQSIQWHSHPVGDELCFKVLR